VTQWRTAASISESTGQMSLSITGSPNLSKPSGSVSRSRFMLPAIAYATTKGGEAR